MNNISDPSGAGGAVPPIRRSLIPDPVPDQSALSKFLDPQTLSLLAASSKTLGAQLAPIRATHNAERQALLQQNNVPGVIEDERIFGIMKHPRFSLNTAEICKELSSNGLSIGKNPTPQELTKLCQSAIERGCPSLLKFLLQSRLATPDAATLVAASKQESVLFLVVKYNYERFLSSSLAAPLISLRDKAAKALENNELLFGHKVFMEDIEHINCALDSILDSLIDKMFQRSDPPTDDALNNFSEITKMIQSNVGNTGHIKRLLFPRNASNSSKLRFSEDVRSWQGDLVRMLVENKIHLTKQEHQDLKKELQSPGPFSPDPRYLKNGLNLLQKIPIIKK